MKIVFAQALSNPTYSTVITMIYFFSRIIIPQFTLFAIVSTNLLFTIHTFLSGRLIFEAIHADHFGNEISVRFNVILLTS
jgi:hypothetical protein